MKGTKEMWGEWFEMVTWLCYYNYVYIVRRPSKFSRIVDRQLTTVTSNNNSSGQIVNNIITGCKELPISSKKTQRDEFDLESSSDEDELSEKEVEDDHSASVSDVLNEESSTHTKFVQREKSGRKFKSSVNENLSAKPRSPTNRKSPSKKRK